MRALTILATAFTITVAPVAAQERETIGVGRLFSNDYLGDGHDRWRTGSYVYSHLKAARPYTPTAAYAFGEVLEYRLRGEIISADPSSAAPGDRPYAGIASFGVHTHFTNGATNLRLGADVIAVGPQTGLSRFQETFHSSLNMPEPVFTDTQLGNQVHLQGSATIGRNYRLGENVSLRPFIEAQIGAEDMIRIGGDIIVGQVGQDDLLLRDVTTGQLYRGTQSGGQGASLVVGADIAAFGDSVFVPHDSGAILSDSQTRARAGVHYQHREGASFFYGLTYLSEEIQGQPEGQVVGSVKLNFNF